MSKIKFVRPHAKDLLNRLLEPRQFIQVITGARQVGKSTLISQVASQTGLPCQIASADQPTLRGPEWIEVQWEAARALARRAEPHGALLVLDEVQKILQWSDKVKRLWDEDTWGRLPLKVVALGSAPLLVQRGLADSLAGRFETLHLPHWTFSEMRKSFGWNLEQFLFFGDTLDRQCLQASLIVGFDTSAIR